MRQWFDFRRILPDSDRAYSSPDGRYSLLCRWCTQTDPERNWDVIIARVLEPATGRVVAEFTTNHRYDYHAWISRDACDYLVFPEAMSGETVIDLTHGEMASYHDGGDGFIWVSFFPSPAGRWLAVQGCVWACPDAVVIYDFARPLDLPLPRIHDLWADHDIGFVAWTSDDEFELSDGRRLSVTSQQTSNQA
jgi:hypothetical protein